MDGQRNKAGKRNTTTVGQKKKNQTNQIKSNQNEKKKNKDKKTDCNQSAAKPRKQGKTQVDTTPHTRPLVPKIIDTTNLFFLEEELLTLATRATPAAFAILFLPFPPRLPLGPLQRGRPTGPVATISSS